MDQKDVFNIIVVGEPGMGKTSFINMFLQQDQQKALQGNDLRGVTKKIQMYETKLSKQNLNVRIYDFPGFGDYDVDMKAIFDQWNKVVANLKIDLVFYCQQYTHKRITIVAKLGFEAIQEGLKFQNIEDNFVLVVTAIDHIKSDEEFQNYKNNFIDKEMLPRLKEILKVEKFNCQVIYSSTYKQQATAEQVQKLMDKYSIQQGVIAQVVTEHFIVKLFKKIYEFFQNNCISLNCTIITALGSKKLNQLKIGDSIIVTKNNIQKEDVIVAMIHKSYTIKTIFLKIVFDDDEYLTLTKQHLIYKSRQFCQAKFLKQGDEILRFDGEHQYISKIKKIEEIEEIGFISPLSSSGVMTINNCIVSCYSQCSTQEIGDIFTSPIRKFKIFRQLFKQNSDEEIHPYFRMLMTISKVIGIK